MSRPPSTALSRVLASVVLASAACKKAPPPPIYLTVPVEHRDIIVTAQAAGTVQPDTTVEVKSKASGEILSLPVETGQVVKRGDLLATIDPRVPNNTLAQAQADLDVAKAKLTNATSQRRRSDELYQSRSITEQEHEQALLDQANANADVVRAQVAIETARDQLEDTKVLAPTGGTILAKTVERGQVISSPTKDVGGGTALLTMADLSLVQVRTLVDETDIGKIQPGQSATIAVEAFPNRPFEGYVLKIEPQAQTQQNVTMFPVLVRIDNQSGLLRPGMNADVEIHIGQRANVLAVPNGALRTQRDVGSAAQVLNLSPSEVERQLAASQPSPTDSGAARRTSQADSSRDMVAMGGRDSTMRRDSTGRRDSTRGRNSMGSHGQRGGSGGAGGGSDAIGRSAGGGSAGRGGAGNGGAGGGGSRRFGRPSRGQSGRYIVFVKRPTGPVPVWIRTGLTDLDYSEVVSGLSASDSVLVLPSASLVESQQEFKERINRVTGGGGVPGMQQQNGNGRSGASGRTGGGAPGRSP